MPHPFRDVAIAGVFNTEQARHLDGHDSASIAVEGALGALADAGIGIEDVDGIAGQFAAEMVLGARMGPCSRKLSTHGIPTVLDAASMIAFGECEVVVIAAGGAAMYTERSATAPWTRPSNELVVGYGLFTAAEFALMARRHMLTYGTTPEQLATAAATIRNNGHVNPEAVYYERGPFDVEDILGSRMVADPFHLLECAMTSEGGCGMVLTDRGPCGDRAHETGVDPRRRRRHVRSGLRRATGVGPARSRRRHSGRVRRAARRAPVLRARGARARRRRRRRAVRPLLVRGHPPARSVRFLRRRRGWPVRGGRSHRPRWPHPGDDRRRHDVVQPRGTQRADAPTGHPGGAAAARHRASAVRSTAPRSRCAATADRARCSTTSCCWGRRGRDDAAAAGARDPDGRPVRVGRAVLGGVCGRGASLPEVRRLRIGEHETGAVVRRVRRPGPHAGNEARDVATSTAGRWSGVRSIRRSVCRTHPPSSSSTKGSG